MATTFTSRQRREREDAVLAMLHRGKGVADIAEKFSITKQAVWQFLAIRGWLDRAKANDAKIRTAAAEAKKAADAALAAARKKKREDEAAARAKSKADALALREAEKTAALVAREKAKADAAAKKKAEKEHAKAEKKAAKPAVGQKKIKSGLDVSSGLA